MSYLRSYIPSFFHPSKLPFILLLFFLFPFISLCRAPIYLLPLTPTYLSRCSCFRPPSSLPPTLTLRITDLKHHSSVTCNPFREARKEARRLTASGLSAGAAPEGRVICHPPVCVGVRVCVFVGNCVCMCCRLCRNERKPVGDYQNEMFHTHCWNYCYFHLLILLPLA